MTHIIYISIILILCRWLYVEYKMRHKVLGFAEEILKRDHSYNRALFDSNCERAAKIELLKVSVEEYRAAAQANFARWINTVEKTRVLQEEIANLTSFIEANNIKAK